MTFATLALRRAMTPAKALALVMAALTPAPSAMAIVGVSRDGDAFVDRIVMVLARKGGGREGVCTGVALSPRVVLTAAHCLAGATDTLVAVRLHGTTEPISVAAVARHPGYDPNAPGDRRISIDVGLVETSKPLPDGFRMTEFADAAPALGDRVTIAGFGLRQENGPPSDGKARAADLVVSEPLSHVTLWARDPENAGLGGCHGDSGGPMYLADGRLAAVVAWTNGVKGHGCGAITQGPRVAPVRGWIDSVRAGWGE